MIPVVIVALALLVFGWVCFTLGEIYEFNRVERADLDARDQWAEDYQRRNGAA